MAVFRLLDGRRPTSAPAPDGIDRRRPAATGTAAVFVLGLLLLAAAGGCGDDGEPPADRSDAAGVAPVSGDDPATSNWGNDSVSALVVTHGGVGSPPDWSPACQDAADRGAAAGGSALDMATAAVVVMEDEPRFNAGTGANIRLDGRTIQMDAAVMTSDGDFGAVAVIERVQNPVLVARAVKETPHLLLAGEGATRFAHRRGFPDVVPTAEVAVEKARKRVAALLRGEGSEGFETFDWRAAWNYPGPPPDSSLVAPEAGPVESGPGDTVGAVSRAADGSFAAALSTGGTSLTLYGRVGDVPVYACGCYAGPAGAVACTGFGEEIIRHTMARTVYEVMAEGRSAREAVHAGVTLFDEQHSLGVIAVGSQDWAVAANRSMAWGAAAVDSTDGPARDRGEPTRN
ncbi:MAG: isoaspartyl peptidase/L-asparaginase [Candidatus Krumholzibacteriia bacterium]